MELLYSTSENKSPGTWVSFDFVEEQWNIYTEFLENIFINKKLNNMYTIIKQLSFI